LSLHEAFEGSFLGGGDGIERGILTFPLILLTDDELYIDEFKTLTDGFGENIP